MRKVIKNQNISYKAFTLMEMIIVLIIMGILLLFTLYLSGEQIQKVKDKTVKESILAEMQTRYSRNLGSSSFAGEIYDTMQVGLINGGNTINFEYYAGDKLNRENTFVNMFEIKYIAPDYKFVGNILPSLNEVKLKYNPYKILCEIIGDNDTYENIVIIARVNDHKNYCFEIKQKNCRLVEVSNDKCDIMTKLVEEQ